MVIVLKNGRRDHEELALRDPTKRAAHAQPGQPTGCDHARLRIHDIPNPPEGSGKPMKERNSPDSRRSIAGISGRRMKKSTTSS